MKQYTLDDFKAILNDRLSKIEKDRDRFCVNYKDDVDSNGKIAQILFDGKVYVTFDYFVSNMYNEEKFSFQGRFLVRAYRYPEWYKKFIDHYSKDIIHVDEFLRANISENKGYDLWYYLDEYLPIGRREEKQRIAATFDELLIDERNVSYDTLRKCYLVDADITQYLQKDKNNQEASTKALYLYKYTSLETFRKMLNNKTLRMNSICAMNDIYEGAWIDHVLYGEENSSEEKLRYTYLDNINTLITSFASQRDDASMWRLYGNNGNGVCLSFKVDRTKVSKVVYISEGDKRLSELREKVKKLKDEGINIRFKGIDEMKLFVKSSSFNIENEYRFVRREKTTLPIANYEGLLSPFKDFEINLSDGRIPELNIQLTEVCLGHNIQFYNTNVAILISQIHAVFPSINIYESKIKEIR